MKELSLNILDIAQNSVKAGATEIQIIRAVLLNCEDLKMIKTKPILYYF